MVARTCEFHHGHRTGLFYFDVSNIESCNLVVQPLEIPSKKGAIVVAYVVAVKIVCVLRIAIACQPHAQEEAQG